MSNKKKPDGNKKSSGKNKPSRMFRVPVRMAALLDELAEKELDSSAAEQLRNAIREYLHKKGMLPDSA